MVPLGDTEIDVYFWRYTDGRKVWYEWCLEGYYIIKDDTSAGLVNEKLEESTRRVKFGMSELHNLGGKGSNMVIT